MHENAKCTWDVHYVYTSHIGISKFEKHVMTSQFKYETFYYLWVKGFDVRKRDTHSFYSGFFICPPAQHARHLPQRSPRASENQPSRSVSGSQLTDFFKISPNPPRTSGAWCHSHSLTSVSHLELVWHLWVRHPLCARAYEHLR